MCLTSHGSDAILPLWVVVLLVVSLAFALGRYGTGMSARQHFGSWATLAVALVAYHGWAATLYPDCFSAFEAIAISALLGAPAVAAAVSVWAFRRRLPQTDRDSAFRVALVESAVVLIAIAAPIGLVVIVSTATGY